MNILSGKDIYTYGMLKSMYSANFAQQSYVRNVLLSFLGEIMNVTTGFQNHTVPSLLKKLFVTVFSRQFTGFSIYQSSLTLVFDSPS